MLFDIFSKIQFVLKKIILQNYALVHLKRKMKKDQLQLFCKKHFK